jgi:hypothetical protein
VWDTSVGPLHSVDSVGPTACVVVAQHCVDSVDSVGPTACVVVAQHCVDSVDSVGH